MHLQIISQPPSITYHNYTYNQNKTFHFISFLLLISHNVLRARRDRYDHAIDKPSSRLNGRFKRNGQQTLPLTRLLVVLFQIFRPQYYKNHLLFSFIIYKMLPRFFAYSLKSSLFRISVFAEG